MNYDDWLMDGCDYDYEEEISAEEQDDLDSYIDEQLSLAREREASEEEYDEMDDIESRRIYGE